MEISESDLMKLSELNVKNEKIEENKSLLKYDENAGEASKFEYYKWGSIVLLIIQNSSSTILLRYSRVVPGNCSTYIPSIMVLYSELLKFAACFMVSLYQKNHSYIIQRCYTKNTLLLAVPAVCYSIQNNLLFVAASHLEATILQILVQIKVITTALFGIVILGRYITALQWSSLILLIIGVILAQQSQNKNYHIHLSHHQSIGVASSLIIAMLSGFSCVYMEKILKEDTTSLWIRNFQLCMFSIPIQCITVYMQDKDKIHTLGYFSGFYLGYCASTVCLLLLLSLGGVLTASVMRFANNDWKNLAAALSIILSSMVSIVWFDFHLNIMFVIGTLCILLSIYGYEMNCFYPQ